jgi:hypothetical protein
MRIQKGSKDTLGYCQECTNEEHDNYEVVFAIYLKKGSYLFKLCDRHMKILVESVSMQIDY